jgi:hypothetical protein
VKSKKDGTKPSLSAMTPGALDRDDVSIQAVELDGSRS